MMEEVEIELPTLRREQWRLYDAMQRFNCWVCHRRLGKTVLGLEILVAKAIVCDLPDPRFAYMAPEREQAKDIAWLYLQRFTQDIPFIKINQADLRVTFPHNNASIRLYGADNHRLGGRRRGIYLDGVVIDEYAQIAPTVWTQVLRPMLIDRVGWAIFIGTPQGKNHFYQLYQQARQRDYWSDALLTVNDTTAIDPAELAMIREEMFAEDKQADYAQEFLCSWDAPMPGAVYAEQLERMDQEGRVTCVSYDPILPVYTAWDIGPAHTAIWWFQPAGDRVRFIDYEEGPGSLEKWISIVKAKPYNYDHSKLQPPLTRERYEVHYMPHDLHNPDYGYGKTRETIAMDNDFRVQILPRGPVEDRIETGRRLLNRSVFDEVNCADGLNALRSYRYEWDAQRQTYRRVPVHDWASHGADGFGHAALGLMPPPKPLPEHPQPGSFAWARKQAIRAQQGKRVTSTFRVG